MVVSEDRFPKSMSSGLSKIQRSPTLVKFPSPVKEVNAELL